MCNKPNAVMKKHFFNVIAALSLVCGVFAFSGCTDFENDINEINDRLDKLETGSIASLEEQIATLTSSLDEAHNLLDLLQGNVEDLQAADDAMSQQIDALNGEIETVKGQISDLNGQISSLEEELNKKIDDAVAELKESDNAAAERISDLESDLEKAKEDLAKAIADGNANKEAIDELKQKVEDYYNELIDAIEKAETSHSEDIARLDGEISSLKEALAEQTQKLTDLIESVSELEKAVEYLEGLTANIPELENLVDSIQENYLSKEEAQNTFATLESVAALLEKIGGIEGRLDAIDSINVSVGERLQDLEDNYADLKDVIIPGLEADILAAQEAAAKAQESADAAMDFAKNVLGELETLRNALGIYAEAGALEAKMEALDAVDSTLKAKDEELAKLIDELDAAVAADIAGLEDNINDLHDELIDLIDDIKADMVTKDGFEALFMEELNKALAEGGAITNAIAAAINEAREELQDNIDDANGRIDILDEALKDLSDDVAAVIEDLANRIQSLVFVPEYKDGMATSYFYTIGYEENEGWDGDPNKDRYNTNKPLPLFEGQRQRVVATFYVTPEELNTSITAENAVINVVPVKAPRAAAENEPIAGEEYLKFNALPGGRVEVEALVPAEYGELFAIALCIAEDQETKEDIKNGNLANINTGNFVSSDYAQVKRVESDLSDSYVLYNPETKKEFPENDEPYPDFTKDYTGPEYADSLAERAWTDAPAAVNFYENYEIRVKVGEENPVYLTTAEAEEEFFLPEGTLSASYNARNVYFPDELSCGVYTTPDSDRDYGVIASMPATKEEAVKHVGDRVDVLNHFEANGYPVIENITSYVITNKRYVLDFEDQRLDWTYDLAKDYTIITGNNPYQSYGYSGEEYEFREVDVDETSGALGEDGYKNINDIINSGIDPTTKVTRFDGVTSKVPQDVTNTFEVTIDVLASQVDQIATVKMKNYRFTKGHDAVYHVEQTYVDNEAHVEVVITFDLTLGAAPADKKIELGDYKINFVTTGQQCSYTELNVNPIEQAYPGDEYFGAKGIEVFTESLGSKLAGTMYSRNWHTERLEEPENVIWDYTSKDLPSKPIGNISTFIGILDETYNDPKEPEEGYYIRTSGGDITKFGDQFDLTTTITTWYGIEYTFHATSTIEVPAFKLIYDPLLAPNGTAILEGSLYGKKYDFPTVDLTNYVQMENADEAAGTSLWIEFKFVTKEDSEKGILNLPNGGQNLYSPHDGKGNFEPKNIDWGKYTARELEFEAILWLTTGSGNNVEVNSLPLKVITDDPISFSAETRTITDRVSGEDYKINLWEQLVINGVLDGDKNIAMYYGEKDPREYEQFANVVADMPGNLLFKYLIDGEEPTAITFGTPSYKVLDGGYTNAYVNYDAATGVLTYLGENSVLQNDLVITVPVTLHHKLDYNKVEIKEANVTIIINKQIGE